MQQAETIFALSTAPVRAALAVIRLTGPKAVAALEALTEKPLPPIRQAALRAIIHPIEGHLLDEGLVLRFAAPHSFTGEDMVELHLHGGLAVTQSVLAALAALDYLSAAEGGDFTRRAVLNGKMDLTAAEAIADLIDAEGVAQQAQALGQLRGGLRDKVSDWRDRLKTVLAHLEADLEFADEDLPGGLGQSALAELPALSAEIDAMLADRRGLTLRDGLQIALVGPPNAGKSSILNRLAGREAAIVSARAGTTRDIIEVAMSLDGVPVTLVDTAGLRDAGDDIEREGVRRAVAVAAQASLSLFVSAADATAETVGIKGDGADILANADLHIANKADLGQPSGDFDIAFSAKDGTGEEALLAALQRLVGEKAAMGEGAAMTRLRHFEIMRETADYLQRAQDAAALELAAEDLRLAQRALGRMTGAVDVEQLLDVVFSDFCIGK